MRPVNVTLSVIAGIVLVVGIVIGGWQLNWWMANSSANHIAQITQNGLAAQTAFIQEARNLVTESYTIEAQINSPATPQSEVPSLQGQHDAEVTQACDLIYNVTSTLPVDLASFKSTNC